MLSSGVRGSERGGGVVVCVIREIRIFVRWGGGGPGGGGELLSEDWADCVRERVGTVEGGRGEREAYVGGLQIVLRKGIVLRLRVDR